ncbi:whirlin-like isoform X2 [Watersipora subatra]|uniref:whirlin-like isoform X2 n=1 Tax=Watersipora subatra TaxID=2589382 RepID=UPI00355B0514
MDVDRSRMGGGYPVSVASSRSHESHRPPRSKKGTSRTMSRNVRRLQETVNLHLNHYEKELFLDALNEFHSQKDTWAFVELLRTILNTPAKQQLVPMIRLVLPPSDIAEFDKCVQLSAAVARGDQAASRLAIGSSSPLTGYSPRSRATNSRRSNAPLGITHRSLSRGRQRSRSRERPVQDLSGDLDIIQIVPDMEGVGFSIKSGTSGQPGIFVAAVDTLSDAFTQGLSVGDEILEANDIDLSQTSRQDAASILNAARSLTLTVKHSGTQNTLAIRQETYTWVDTNGRSCSPPPLASGMGNTPSSSVSRRSGMSLISSQDERKINLRIEKGHGLGLMIRGGSEYGLGIYITGVDHNSAAQRSGIRVGDQVLAVNDTQCVEITHRDAVKALKRSRHMMLTLKYVGKLPHAKIDRTDLLTSRSRSHSVSDRRSRSQTRRNHSSVSVDSRRAHRYPGSLDRKKYREVERQKNAFTKGAGSQLMLTNSTVIPAHNYTRIDEQARRLLNDEERGTLKFYLDEYSKGFVSVEALVVALQELFNTHSKFQMFHDLRALIRAQDGDKFDQLVLKYEVHSLKSRLDRNQEQMSDFSLESVLSVPSNSSTSESYKASPSTTQKRPPSASHSAASTLLQDGKGSVRSNKMFITDGSNQAIVTDPQTVGSVRNRSLVAIADEGPHTSSENSPRDNGKNPPRMGMRAANISTKLAMRSPSDDSGVDVRAKAGSNSQTGSSYNDTITRDESTYVPPLARNLSQRSDSESSMEASMQHHWQSYSISGSNEEDSDIELLPGLHSDREAKDNSNVVLVGSKQVGTLPRREHKPSLQPAFGESNGPSLTFKEQMKQRTALSGKMYIPPAASQRHEIPLDDSDYDASDIINISKELYRSTSQEREAHKEDGASPLRRDSFNIRDILPPPPTHLLHDSIDTSSSSISERSEDEQSLEKEEGKELLNGQVYLQKNIDKPAPGTNKDDTSSSAEGTDDLMNGYESHPSLAYGRSPVTERKSSISLSEKSSKDIYAVVKRQTSKASRPAMPFDPQPTVHNGNSSVTRLEGTIKATHGAEPEKEIQAGDAPVHEEVIRVNKLRPTLGLAIEGGAGTKQPIPRIKNILEAGCASTSSLKIGQVILRVNDKYLEGLSHNQSARVIADAFRNRNAGYLDFLVRG